MKGLLLKDWYMMKKYCKSYIIIAAAFTALSLASKGNMFFVFLLSEEISRGEDKEKSVS